MKKLVVLASSNAGKIKEFQVLFPEFQIVSARNMGFRGIISEDGESFFENALTKARTVFNALKLPVIADDSGLCVSALNGAPGIHSARYSIDGTDKDNRQNLLTEMENLNYRDAKFVCCLVYIDENGVTYTATGECKGKILNEEVGANGFGYDPIFYSDDLEMSFGVATELEKNTCSHRARAVENLKKKIGL